MCLFCLLCVVCLCYTASHFSDLSDDAALCPGLLWSARNTLIMALGRLVMMAEGERFCFLLEDVHSRREQGLGLGQGWREAEKAGGG